MKLKVPAIYPITDTRISGLSHLEQVTRLIDGGATLIQLREKHASSHEFYNQAVECVEHARFYDVRIMINDRVDIAMLCDAEGVHLGQDDMPPTAARDLLGTGKIIGFSTHSVQQAIAAARNGVDYIAIGPVFETTTKADPDPVIGLEGIREVRSAIGEFPLVAIGGINVDNIADVLDAGADSAAVIGGILGDPEGITSAMSSLVRASRR